MGAARMDAAKTNAAKMDVVKANTVKMDTAIGVMALQGAFAEHMAMLETLGAEVFEIRSLSDLNRRMDGLILPGGESTVQGKLLRELGLFEPLRERIQHGLPVFGTCAGMILLAKELENDERLYFAAMDIQVRRNAYGRQMGSFLVQESFADRGNVTMPFIRAPYVSWTGKGAKVLAAVNGKMVAVRQENCLAVSFHPELTKETAVHEYFLEMVRENMA